jgi:5-methyltetrahydrofolate--homocysteine methyltransferase
VFEGVMQEMKHIANPSELKHIQEMYEKTDPLMQEIAYALITGNDKLVDQLTSKALNSGFAANTVMDDGLIAGMAIVGIKFRDNIIFVPEVLISARAMKAGMVHIEPILSASDIPPAGIVIMGTVKGDLHDIGKNLCIMMLRGAGFVVHDLGVDTKPEQFIDAVQEHEAKVLGMSALLNCSGFVSTPKSCTTNPAPLNIMIHKFFPISCKSPFTVPIITIPAGGMSEAERIGSICTIPAFIALAEIRTSGTKIMLSLNFIPTIAIPAIKPSSITVLAANPELRAFEVNWSTSLSLPVIKAYAISCIKGSVFSYISCICFNSEGLAMCFISCITPSNTK